MAGLTGDGARSEPVKMVLERRAHPGAKEALDAWVKELIASAARSPALEGSSVITASGGEYIILLRFASQADLDHWHSSPDVSALCRKADTVAAAPEKPAVQTGLETWFTLPGAPAPPSPPPKWKMALVTWGALLPQVIALSFIVPRTLPFPLGPAVSTAIPVAMLAWVVMPRLTKLLYPWLYPSTRKPSPAREALAREP